MYLKDHFSKVNGQNVEVRVFYRGKKIANESLGENESINKLYPSNETFMQQYQALKNITSPGKRSLLEISENGILNYPDVLL